MDGYCIWYVESILLEIVIDCETMHSVCVLTRTKIQNIHSNTICAFLFSLKLFLRNFPSVRVCLVSYISYVASLCHI